MSDITPTGSEFLMIVKNLGDDLSDLLLYKAKVADRYLMDRNRSYRKDMLNLGISAVFYKGYLWIAPLTREQRSIENELASYFGNDLKMILSEQIPSIFEALDYPQAMALIRDAIEYAVWVHLDERLLDIEWQQAMFPLIRKLMQVSTTNDRNVIIHALFEKAKLVLEEEFTRFLVLRTREGIGIYRPMVPNSPHLKCKGIMIKPIRIDKANVGLSLLPRATVINLESKTRKLRPFIVRFLNGEAAYIFTREMAREIFPLRVTISNKKLKFDLTFLEIAKREKTHEFKEPTQALIQKGLMEWIQ